MNNQSFLLQRSQIPMRQSTKGGAILLNRIRVKPESIKGAGLTTGSNRIVGIISHPPVPIIPISKNVPVQGGDLLNRISFGKSIRNNSHRDSNIKFVF